MVLIDPLLPLLQDVEDQLVEGLRDQYADEDVLVISHQESSA